MVADVEQEYQRLLKIFSGADEKKIELNKKLIYEAAFCAAQLQTLEGIILESGMVRFKHGAAIMKTNSAQIELTKVRASYIHIMAQLNKIFGNTENEEDLFGEWE